MLRSRFAELVLLAASVGCSSGVGSGGNVDAASGGSDGGVDARSGDKSDAGDPASEPVRFVAMGDTGTGSETQFQVGNTVGQFCATKGCDFVILLGDNIYDSGPASVADAQWVDKFEAPYENVALPFYAVLGNHDYGGNLFGVESGGLGNEFDKGSIEVDYSDHSSKWTMPATHYTLRLGNVGFIMLDTNSIMWGDTSNGDQGSWYPAALAEVADAEWVIGVGHHPLRSNGAHGNAGNYESLELGGIDVPNPLPILNGGNVKSFFDNVVCGTVDMYISGHDHTRQLIDEPEALCGAPMLVSGAGAKVKDLVGHGNNTLFEDASKAGFAYVVIEDRTMTVQFVDATGAIEYEHTYTR